MYSELNAVVRLHWPTTHPQQVKAVVGAVTAAAVNVVAVKAVAALRLWVLWAPTKGNAGHKVQAGTKDRPYRVSHSLAKEGLKASKLTVCGHRAHCMHYIVTLAAAHRH